MAKSKTTKSKSSVAKPRVKPAASPTTPAKPPRRAPKAPAPDHAPSVTTEVENRASAPTPSEYSATSRGHQAEIINLKSNISTPASLVTSAGEQPGLTHALRFTAERPAAAQLTQREWLLTNGTGAFAMGTPAGVNTRRYHALLVAATRPPVGRIAALNQLCEQLVLTSPDKKQQTIDLTSLLFKDPHGRDVLAPAGHTLLRQFAKGTFARWEYQWGPIRVTRELYLHWEDQAITLRYRIQLPSDSPAGSAMLRLSPMLTLRDYHDLVRRDRGAPFRLEPRADSLVVHRGDLAVTLAVYSGGPGPALWRDAVGDPWWYNVFYPCEAQRGQDAFEDYFVPGAYEVPLHPAGDTGITFTAALGTRPADPDGWTIDERLTRLHTITHALVPKPAPSGPDSSPSPSGRGQGEGVLSGAGEVSLVPSDALALAIAADDFIVGRQSSAGQSFRTVLAGYPWFADWGRDTFIALPGLLLTTQRYEEARDVLHVFAQNIRDGLVPNRFDDYDGSAAHYNAVDASLWYIRAAILYLEATGDHDTWLDWLGPACLKIMDAYIRGINPGIRVAGDGLVTAGDPTTQLTWMDAAAHDPRTGQRVVFTPRPGKAVEINALWYYALMRVGEIIREQSDDGRRTAAHFEKLADRMRRSFPKIFWDEGRGCLRDHVWVDPQGQEHADLSLRPNQVLAVSLPISPLPRTKQTQVLATLKQHLLTPMGLRTLPAGDPNYHPHYAGDGFTRDAAYHQGTIWPWLIGPYAEAILRVGDFSLAARQEALAAVTPLLDFLRTDGLGQVHEIFQAEPNFDGTHAPVGCPAQAWSVAELIRVLHLAQA